MRMTRRGFTMIELALTLVVIGILATMAMAKVGSTISRSKVDRAASMVAADLENAFSTGGRLRQPLVISCDCANRIYRVNDQVGDRSAGIREVEAGDIVVWSYVEP